MTELILLPEKEKEDNSIKLSGNNEHIEAGDMGREMGKEYMKQIEDMRQSHSRLKGIYYILVYHYQQAYLPTAQYVTMCSMRKENIPQKAIQGCDLWKVNNDNDTLELMWAVPHRESWKQLENHESTDPTLRNYMQHFKEGII